MRVLSGLAIVFATVATVQAASLVRRGAGEGGDLNLSVTTVEGVTGGTTTMFTCNPSKREYALVLIAGGFQPPPGGAEIEMSADDAPTGRILFEAVEESLMHLPEPEAGRRLMAQLLRARTVKMKLADRTLRFALSDGGADVARFRTACGL